MFGYLLLILCVFSAFSLLTTVMIGWWKRGNFSERYSCTNMCHIAHIWESIWDWGFDLISLSSSTFDWKIFVYIISLGSMSLHLGADFKDDRNFSAFFDPLPPSERKMTPFLLNAMTSLLLIVTAFGRPPLPPKLRSSLKNAPLTKTKVVLSKRYYFK